MKRKNHFLSPMYFAWAVAVKKRDGKEAVATGRNAGDQEARAI
jgi:hypothetical protein